jgi:hypothetical protein
LPIWQPRVVSGDKIAEYSARDFEFFNGMNRPCRRMIDPSGLRLNMRIGGSKEHLLKIFRVLSQIMPQSRYSSPFPASEFRCERCSELSRILQMLLKQMPIINRLSVNAVSIKFMQFIPFKS